MNAKLSMQRFLPCPEYGLVKMIAMTPHKAYVGSKLSSAVD